MPNTDSALHAPAPEGSSTLRNVAIFCIMLLLSAFGYEFLFLILTVHVYDITHKAFSVGVFTAITFLPKLFSPVYGVLVDRFDRKLILAINAGMVGVLVFALGLAQHVAAIYALWFVATIFIMFINTARTALMTEIMPAGNYMWGNSVILAILNTARIVAPLMAGLIMHWMDKSVLILLSGGVYVLCSAMSIALRLDERDKITFTKFGEAVFYVKEGLRYIAQNSSIRSLGTIGVFWRLFLGMQFSLFVVYVTKHLGKSEVEYGVFMTAIALGSLVGSVIGPFVARLFHEKPIIMAGLVLHYASFCALGLIANYHVALVVAFTAYCVFYVTIVGIHSVRDRSTRANIRGRVYGASTSIFTPPTIVSILVCGYLADVLGVHVVFVCAGSLAVVSAVWIVWSLKVPAREPLLATAPAANQDAA